MYTAEYYKFHTEKENMMDKLDELLMDAPIWDWIADRFPRSPEEAAEGIWYDGGNFLCKTEAQAEGLADWMANLTGIEINTSYYDPEEDERHGETDRYTGWYSVYVA